MRWWTLLLEKAVDWFRSRPITEPDLIHDCRPIASPVGSLTGRLSCRICGKRIGRHERIDEYGNWQHGHTPRFGPGALLAPVSVTIEDVGIKRTLDEILWPPRYIVGEIDDTAGVKVANETNDLDRGACGFSGCRCVETNPSPDEGYIGKSGGIPIYTTKHPDQINAALARHQRGEITDDELRRLLPFDPWFHDPLGADR